MENINVLIPAAGKGSRSGLTIPKSLQEVNGIPIIVRLCNQLVEYDDNPMIVINPKDEVLFLATFKKNKIKARIIYQSSALGMGHAILQAKAHIKDGEQILLVWSDIPFLQKATIDTLVRKHLEDHNIFSLASFMCKDPYTVVERDGKKVVRLSETHKNKDLVKVEKGERDIGLFIFDKRIVLDLIETEFENYDKSSNTEFGFLSVVESLSAMGYKIEAYPIAHEKDILSFNTPEDLIKITQTRD